MKKLRVFKNCMAVLLAVLLLFGVFCCTANAAPDGGDSEITTDDGSGDDGSGDGSGEDPAPGEEPDGGDQGGDDAPADPDDGGDTQTEAPTEAQEEPADEPEDAQSTYTEPEYLDDLPAADDGEVVSATAIPVPVATVSEASLLSGIVMWLCVAVGVAVVVGVLVSKRTRRRG